MAESDEAEFEVKSHITYKGEGLAIGTKRQLERALVRQAIAKGYVVETKGGKTTIRKPEQLVSAQPVQEQSNPDLNTVTAQESEQFEDSDGDEEDAAEGDEDESAEPEQSAPGSQEQKPRNRKKRKNRGK
jgi:hypothetical protein